MRFTGIQLQKSCTNERNGAIINCQQTRIWVVMWPLWRHLAGFRLQTLNKT